MHRDALGWAVGFGTTYSVAAADPPANLGVIADVVRLVCQVVQPERQEALLLLAPAIVATSGDGLDSARSALCADWELRAVTPAWLEAAGFVDDAAALRAAPAIVDGQGIDALSGVVFSAARAVQDQDHRLQAEMERKGPYAQWSAAYRASQAAFKRSHGQLWLGGGVTRSDLGRGVLAYRRKAVMGSVRVSGWLAVLEASGDDLLTAETDEVTAVVDAALEPVVGSISESAADLLERCVRVAA